RQRAVEPGQFRLVVEQLRLTRSTGHEEVDHALRLRRVVRHLRCERIVQRRLRRCNAVTREQVHERERTKADASLLDETNAGEQLSQHLRRTDAALGRISKQSDPFGFDFQHVYLDGHPYFNSRTNRLAKSIAPFGRRENVPFFAARVIGKSSSSSTTFPLMRT